MGEFAIKSYTGDVMSNITGDNFTPQNVAKNNAQNTDDYAVILLAKSNQDVREITRKKEKGDGVLSLFSNGVH